MQSAYTGLAEAVTLSILPMAPCINTNQILFGPMSKIIQDVEGALGGLLFGVVTLLIVAFALRLIVTITSNKAPTYMRAIALVALVPVGTILVVITYNAFIIGFNSVC
ncbi:MAG: hypothetical protein EOM24_27535 [Chloroflexia bacterium]|nr:hypothetical protein [Chloroflexia bacterium]